MLTVYLRKRPIYIHLACISDFGSTKVLAYNTNHLRRFECPKIRPMRYELLFEEESDLFTFSMH